MINSDAINEARAKASRYRARMEDAAFALAAAMRSYDADEKAYYDAQIELEAMMNEVGGE